MANTSAVPLVAGTDAIATLPPWAALLFAAAAALLALGLAFIPASHVQRIGVPDARYRQGMRWAAGLFAALAVIMAALWMSVWLATILSDFFVRSFGFDREHAGTVAFSTLGGTFLWFGVLGIGVATAIGEYRRGVALAGPNGAAGVVPQSALVARNCLMAMGGSLVGWGVAMVFSPYNDVDRAALQSAWQSASLLLSGFLLSKFDRLLEGSLFDKDKAPTANWVPFGLFLASALVVLLVVITHRLYGSAADSITFNVVAANQQLTFPRLRAKVVSERLILDDVDLGSVKVGTTIVVEPGVRRVWVGGVLMSYARIAAPAANPAPAPGSTGSPSTEGSQQQNVAGGSSVANDGKAQ